MSIPDDHVNPPPTTSKTLTGLAGGKRKRENTSNATAENRDDGGQVGTHVEQLQQLFRDTVELLRRLVPHSMEIECPAVADKLFY